MSIALCSRRHAFSVSQLVLACCCVAASVAPCEADVLTWNFSGRLTFVSSDIGGTVAIGDAALLTIAFDTSTPSSEATSTAATYPSAVTSVSVQIGAYTYALGPDSTWNFIQVSDNASDVYPVFDGITFSAPVEGDALNGISPVLMQVNLGDTTGLALNSVALPVVPPPLSALTPGFQNFCVYFGGSSSICGELLTIASSASPFGVCPLYDEGKAVKSGATIPIKLSLCAPDGTNQSSADIVVNAVSLTRVSTSADGPVSDAGQANPDSNFRFDPGLGAGGGYIFNLKTSGLETGTYKLNFFATGDAALHSVQFQVR